MAQMTRSTHPPSSRNPAFASTAFAVGAITIATTRIVGSALLLAAVAAGAGPTYAEPVPPTAIIQTPTVIQVVASPDKAETPVTIQQITVAQANEIVRNRVGDLAVEERVRVFRHGVQFDLDPATLTVIRDAADSEAQTGMLVYYGKIGSTEVAEDLRFMLHGDLAYVLRDIYIDPTDETVFVGRSIPSPLDAKRGFEFAKRAAAVTVVSPPAITGISGATSVDSGVVDGVSRQPCGPAFDGLRVRNNISARPGAANAFPWEINGSGFGATAGTVKFDGRTVQTTKWTNTTINANVVDPTPGATTTKTALLEVTTAPAAGGKTALYAVSVVGATLSRVWGQCTAHAELARIEMGLLPSPDGYKTGYIALDKSYTPVKGDQYKWTLPNKSGTGTSPHTGVLKAVTKSAALSYTTGTTKVETWLLTITQRNALCTNVVNEYPTTFQKKTESKYGIAVTTVTAYPKSQYNGQQNATFYYPYNK